VVSNASAVVENANFLFRSLYLPYEVPHWLYSLHIEIYTASHGFPATALLLSRYVPKVHDVEKQKHPLRPPSSNRNCHINGPEYSNKVAIKLSLDVIKLACNRDI